MPADLSPLAAANELVCRLRCGGIIAHTERVNQSSRVVRCGLSSNYFNHLIRIRQQWLATDIFFSTSQETAWEQRLQNDLFCFELDVKPYLKVKVCIFIVHETLQTLKIVMFQWKILLVTKLSDSKTDCLWELTEKIVARTAWKSVTEQHQKLTF